MQTISFKVIDSIFLKMLGCSATSYYVSVWPIYPTYPLHSIHRHRAFHCHLLYLLSLPFRKTVASSWPYSQASNVSTRFLWLMLLAGSPYLKLYNISLSPHVPLNPWISWENVHLNFSRIPQVPSLIWRSNGDDEIAFKLELSRRTAVFCAFLCFGFLGFHRWCKEELPIRSSICGEACWNQRWIV